MPRVKLSEFRAKTILNNHLKTSYTGFPFNAETDAISKLDESVQEGKRYVVKVDQGVKKRFKQGLVKLDLIRVDEVVDALAELRRKGFSHFIVEEFVPHEKEDERYIALERTALGTAVSYSTSGGVDIEENQGTVKHELINDVEDITRIAIELMLEPETLEKIVEVFDINYFSFLEINPLVISFKKPYILDVASEVDSAAEFFVDNWSLKDVREHDSNKTPEEKEVAKLAQKSSSSLTLKVLNPNGAIFMLLSGGGVSVVLADEVANLGKGEMLANYGEYSGNPTEEETYIYTKNLLSLLFKSEAPKKVLIIGGGVANFTDIRITFKGVVRALREVLDELKKQNVRVYARRGGPHQKEGLALLSSFMKENGIEGEVYGPELVASEIVEKAIKYV